MSTLILKVEALAGTTIEDACRDLCALADRVGILCEVPFNGVDVWAFPGTNPARLADAWREQIKRPGHHYRIADARPAAGVAERDPRCGYPYCACVGQCFAASQPGAAGVKGEGNG
jgi:hypothetical protein